MTKRYVRYEILRALLAKTGNQCAYPECQHVLFNEDNIFVAQVCHIEAVSPKGPRYNLNQSNEERNSYSNLLFLCYRHHKETDNVEKYSVERLQQIKVEHEMKFNKTSFVVNTDMVKQIEEEFTNYWLKIKELNEDDEVKMRIEIDTEIDFHGILLEMSNQINWLNEQIHILSRKDEGLSNEILIYLEQLKYNTDAFKKVHYYNNSFVNRNWEFFNLGLSNFSSKFKLLLAQLEIKYFEVYLRVNPDDEDMIKRLENVKQILEGFAKNLNYTD